MKLCGFEWTRESTYSYSTTHSCKLPRGHKGKRHECKEKGYNDELCKSYYNTTTIRSRPLTKAEMLKRKKLEAESRKLDRVKLIGVKR